MEIRDRGPVLAAGLAFSHLTPVELWTRYFALGGTHSLVEMAAYLRGISEWTGPEHDVAAQALNEYFTEHGLDHPVAYADEL